MTLQSSMLALLLTFSDTPWYAGYTATTRAWGLEQLADQHLAGAIMWVPAGLVYLGIALALLVEWVRARREHAGAVALADPRSKPGPAIRMCSAHVRGCDRAHGTCCGQRAMLSQAP